MDNTKPTVSLTGSGTSATITMSDNVGVVKYYFGATNPSTTNITWTTITSTTNTTINQTVSAAGTQYLIAMDAAGNVATTTLEYTQITGTFYYQSNATSGSETVSSTTASCIKASTDSGCSVTIPSAVKSSVGKYNNAYAGLSSSTGNMTQAVASGTTSVNLSTDTSYYAIYRSSVTNYYYGTSYTSRTLYRNQWFTSTTAMATTVLSTSTTGTSNYSTAVGPGSSVWSGLSTAADTTAEYANVAAAATSASGTLYTVYQFNITYAKSTNVSSIGATSGSCKVSATGASAGGTSCSVTLPTITANTGYTVQGWYTATGGGGTKAGNASASYTVSSTGATLYAYAKDTTAPTGSVTATLNGTTVNATVSASDTGSGLATTGTYGWKISSSSTCNSSVTGWTTNTNASYNFTGQSAGTLYVCVRVADKSGNYGYLSTQVKVKAYLKVVAYNTAYRTSTYSTKIKTVKFVQGVSNSGAVASWDLSENADNKVIGWIKNNTSNTSFYDLYIGSNYSIYAKNLYQEFLGLSNATSFDLNNLNTIECTNMYAMFSGACNNGNNSTLTFNFGSSFDTRNVTDMSQMFSSAAAYANNVNINITADFNTSNVTNTYYMFASVGDQCKGNVLINLGNNFSIPKVTNATDMFSQVGGNTTKNVTIKLGSNFNATNLTNTYGMFARIGHNAPSVNINLGNNFNLSNAQNADRMFYATARNSANVYIDLGNNFNGSKLKSTLEMFEDAGFFQTSSYSLNLGNNFITSNVTTMKNMFRDSGGNATNFSINLGSHFDMTNVNNAFQMFHNVGNKSTKAFILNLAPGTLAKMGTICNGYSGCYGMFEGVPSGKVTVYVKDSTTRQWFINQNSNWGTSFSASNVLIK